MTVYLLHIDPPLRHSKHYVGYCRSTKELFERLGRHRNGTGGVLPREAVKKGSKLSLSIVWPEASKEFEKYVKQHGGATRYCPMCGLHTRAMPKEEKACSDKID